MAKAPDLRGSEGQRCLWELVKQLYPGEPIEWEYVLPGIGRIDIFLPLSGIAFEFDGRQHTHYVQHFHGDINGYINSIKSDSKKDEFLSSKGVKVIRINFDEDLSIELLQDKLSSAPEPLVHYDGLFGSTKKTDSDYIRSVKDRRNRAASEFRKSAYQRYKASKNKK